jgi:hypothetical protein
MTGVNLGAAGVAGVLLLIFYAAEYMYSWAERKRHAVG